MSIIIHGMKMPKFGECIVITSDGVASKYLDGDVAIYYDARPDKASAAELPPHGRLIDVDKMERFMSNTVQGDIRGYPYDGDTWDLAFSWLDHADTILPADPEKEDT